jgi:hypothetical protein
VRNTIVGINSNKKSSIASTMIMDISNAGMVVNGNMQTGGKMMVLADQSHLTSIGTDG